METITIHPRTQEEAKAFEQMAIALKISFEKHPATTDYTPEFGAQIKRSEKEFKEGKGVKMTMKEFWNTISDETAQKLHHTANQVRNEWERGI